MTITLKRAVITLAWPFLAIFILLSIQSCNSNAAKKDAESEKLLSLPVFQVDTATAIKVRDYLGTIEGKINVEIRPQVEGILEYIYVDEGSFVKKGQKLFKINELPYREALKNAVAEERVEKAKEKNARLEVENLQSLFDNDVISEVQLSTAQSNYEVASASVAKAATAVATTKIDVDFTSIKAPSDGYIGRIPKRIGNLVSKSDSEPITILSDTREVYVYFSMSESDFLHFTKKGRIADSVSAANKSELIPYVRLILADGTEYNQKGIVDAVNAQVNSTTGAISLRASFPNHEQVLRHGNTGTLKIEERRPGVLLIPQIAVTELQDKKFVHTVNAKNQIKMRAVELDGTSGPHYIIKEGIEPGDRVVLAGLDRLEDGMLISPQVKNPEQS